MIGGGLQRSTEDKRDLKFGAVHPPINLNEIEKDFDVLISSKYLERGIISCLPHPCLIPIWLYAFTFFCLRDIKNPIFSAYFSAYLERILNLQ